MTTAFQVASDLVEDTCALSPILCTHLGIPGSDHEWGDSFGLDGKEKVLEMQAR